MSQFKIKFWGTRGSIPSPGPKTMRYGGNTSCVEIDAGGALSILDAGTGMRELGDELLARLKGGPINANIYITHTHWDHIQGFPFFVPAYVPGNKLRLHGPHGMGKSFEKVFRDLLDPNNFPVDLGDMRSDISFVEVKGGPMEYDGVKVLTSFTNHPGMDLAYRFERGGKIVVYLTDHEPYCSMHEKNDFFQKQDNAVTEFCRGADLLIADAQYTDEEYLKKRTWGHSRYKDTVQLAADADVKKLALFHHDPYHPDDILEGIGKDAERLAKETGKHFDCFYAEGQASKSGRP